MHLNIDARFQDHEFLMLENLDFDDCEFLLFMLA